MSPEFFKSNKEFKTCALFMDKNSLARIIDPSYSKYCDLIRQEQVSIFHVD